MGRRLSQLGELVRLTAPRFCQSLAIELAAWIERAPGMIGRGHQAGGRAGRHGAKLGPGHVESPQLDRIERRRGGQQLPFAVADFADEPDVGTVDDSGEAVRGALAALGERIATSSGVAS